MWLEKVGFKRISWGSGEMVRGKGEKDVAKVWMGSIHGEDGVDRGAAENVLDEGGGGRWIVGRG